MYFYPMLGLGLLLPLLGRGLLNYPMLGLGLLLPLLCLYIQKYSCKMLPNCH